MIFRILTEDSHMREIGICAMFFLFLLLLSPMTVGVNIHQKPEEKPLANDWTYLWGTITRPRHVNINGGDYVTFNAIFVHYRTHWFGNIRSGFFHHFETILLPELHFGFLGRHFVFAKFNMGLVPYVA
jgi:hypothetical protein